MKKVIKKRNIIVYKMIVTNGAGSGVHKDRVYDIKKGISRKIKHKKKLEE